MKKFRRSLLTIMLSILMIGGLAATSISNAAVGDEAYLKAVHIRKGGWGYGRSGYLEGPESDRIEKIKQYVSSQNGETVAPAEMDALFYCIYEGKHIGRGEDTTPGSVADSKYTETYIEQGDLTSKFSEVNTKFGLTENNYYHLVWLLDNLYYNIGENNAEKKNTYLNTKMGISAVVYKTIDDWNDSKAMAFPSDELDWNDILTDDDIDVVQQLAVWNFTNPGRYNGLGEFTLSNTNNEKRYIEDWDWDDVIYDKKTGRIITDNTVFFNNQLKMLKHVYMEILYNSLIESATTKGTAAYFNDRQSNDIEDNWNDENPLVASKKSGFYTVGPYNLPSQYKDKGYTLNELNFTSGGRNINNKIKVLVGSGDLTNLTNIDSLISAMKSPENVTWDDIKNGNLYFAISAEDAKTINEVHVELKLQTNVNNIVYYTSKENADENQPVVKVEPKTINITLKSDFIIPKDFDLALRKYITKVTKNYGQANATTQTLTGTSEAREPKLSAEDIAKIEENNTADYKHRKDPLTVETGDVVTYKITVYNEGAQAGYATEIVDQLPTGLKFIKVVSGNFTADNSYSESGNNTLVLKRSASATTPLKSFDGTNLASETVELECEVTEVPDASNTKILTNVAWISEEKNTDTGEVITNQTGKDRDSEPATKPNVNKNNMSDYKGNTNNPDVLPAKPDTYYKGQQDDDDFEKLQLLPKTFDLALRKFITKVTKIDGTENKYEETVTREPSIEQSELEKLGSIAASLDGGKTATKNHTKDPVPVDTGDIVTYTIRVYNEGQVDGKAVEITDYLPDGLELVPANQSSTNAKYGWKVDASNSKKITTDFLSKASDIYEDPTLKAFSATKVNGNYVIDYKDVQIECRVVKTVAENNQSLKNVAEITNSSNDLNLPDRDSTPNDVHHNDKNDNYNPTNPRTGRGEQDDDDYEELILQGKLFDLALRKYIIKVTKQDGTEEEYKNEKSREPVITDSDLEKLANGTSSLDDGKTAVKTHTKYPVSVDTGDIVTYTIRVYNEGQVDGKAVEITDYLPDGLELVPANQSSINEKYGWKVDANNSKKITTDFLSKVSDIYEDPTLKAFSTTKVNGHYVIDYKDVQVECRVVKTTADNNKSLKNVAEITNSSNALNLPDRDSTPNDVHHNDKNDNYNPTNPTTGRGEQDDDDYEELILKEKEFDLALRKFITKVTKQDGTEEKYEGEGKTRVPRVTDADLEKLANGTSNLDEGKTTVKTHPKSKIPVDTGDIVTYTIRVYNEGQVDGKADEITDYLPDGLELVPAGTGEGKSTINAKYGWKVDANNSKKITTDYLSKASEEYADPTLKAFSTTKVNNEYVIDYKDVQVECKVVKTVASTDQSLKNVAEITNSSNDLNLPDRDSTPNNVNHNDKNDNYNPTNPTTGRGEQDDDDYEELVLKAKEFDLALRKYITKVTRGNKEINIPNSRDLNDIDTSKLNTTDAEGRKITTAEYKHRKDPVVVEKNDIITYTFRVYNEGDIKGTVTKITDYLPNGLELDTTGLTKMDSNDTNVEKWSIADLDSNGEMTGLFPTVYYTFNKSTRLLTIEYKTEPIGEYEIFTLEPYNPEKEDENTRERYITRKTGWINGLNYGEVSVNLVVTADPDDDEEKVLTNTATMQYNAEGITINDRDSNKDGNDNFEKPSDLEENPGYTGKEDKTLKDLEDDIYHEGKEDDDDFEKIVILPQSFDLALRKFITAINDTEITTRIPKVYTSKLNTIGEDGKVITTAEYSHPKEPVLVTNGNIVTYTIRVYNEGNIDGYASKIKDDMPAGLEFLPDNETNIEYRWIMLNDEGKETKDIRKAVAISTDYLSKEQEEARTKATSESNDGKKVDVSSLIPAYDAEKDELYYKDVKVAFKVIEPNTSDRILKNEAQISENRDENNNEITDRDSTPDEWKDEDDEDIEKVKVQYFDLSLRKWVTQAIVYDNGTETVTETGHKAEDDPESIVKVEIKDKKLDSVTVKFRYKIRVTNEGTIAGYATEIKDYIPSGLEFVAEDNPEWKQTGDKIIVTEQAKNILLQPGESTEVEVILTWINGEENLALQMNYAEISKDYNEFDAPDIDSTPNNKKEGEDDIDDAPVLLSIKTGQVRIYFALTGSILLVIIAGVAFIKKYII